MKIGTIKCRIIGHQFIKQIYTYKEKEGGGLDFDKIISFINKKTEYCINCGINYKDLLNN